MRSAEFGVNYIQVKQITHLKLHLITNLSGNIPTNTLGGIAQYLNQFHYTNTFCHMDDAFIKYRPARDRENPKPQLLWAKLWRSYKYISTASAMIMSCTSANVRARTWYMKYLLTLLDCLEFLHTYAGLLMTKTVLPQCLRVKIKQYDQAEPDFLQNLV